MIKVFNTGETPEELKNEYNPEGSDLRKAQLRLLEMLIYLDSVCNKIGVPYRLDGGNVIGALRHGGFIPWDDDVDVKIEYKYYNKLCNYLLEHPHPQFVLQCHKTDHGRLEFWNTLRDTKSKYVHNHDSRLNSILKYQGLQIDLFCHVPGIIPSLHYFSRVFHRRVTRKLVNINFYLALLSFHFEKDIMYPIFYLISKLFGDQNYYQHVYGSSFGTRYPKDMLLPYKDLEFEGRTFPGPAKAEELCEKLYKNYMDLPPKEKRHHHDVRYIFYD